MRVVVVGAGFAGLSAAHRLREHGVDVEVVEAGPRVGGRARTVPTGLIAGQYVESGAEWVDTDHHRMRELLGRYGMGLQGAGQEWTMIRRLLFRDGVLLDPRQVRSTDPAIDRELERYEAAFVRIADGIADPARPDLHPDAGFHDVRSMADIAAEADLGALATLFAHRNSQGEFAAEPGEVSSLFVAQQRAQMSAHGAGEVVRAHRVDGGLSGLAGAMADDLDASIALDEPVLRISWNDDAVQVVTPRRTVDADHVVLACSLVPLRAVRFDPSLPPLLAAAIAELGYGAITKTAVQFASRTWPAGYANTSLASQRVYEPTVDQPGDAGVLMSYAGGDGGRELAALDEAERMRIVAGDIEAMYGLGQSPIGGFSRAWSVEPRYGGSYAVYRPGQVMAHWQVLRTPHGPIRLAGEHTATWTGYLEGALESGARVADEIAGERG